MVPSEMESTAQMMPELYRLLYIQRKHQNHAADDEYHCFLSPHSARKKLTQKPYGRPSGQRAFALLHCPLHSRRVYSIPGNVVYRPSTHNNKRIIVEYRVRFPFSSPQIKNVDATPFKFKGFFFIILLFLRQRPETDRDRSKEATAKKRLLKVSFFSIGGIDFFFTLSLSFLLLGPVGCVIVCCCSCRVSSSATTMTMKNKELICVQCKWKKKGFICIYTLRNISRAERETAVPKTIAIRDNNNKKTCRKGSNARGRGRRDVRRPCTEFFIICFAHFSYRVLFDAFFFS